MPSLIPNRRHFACLIVLWAMLLPFYAVWLWQDRVTAPWDMSGHAKGAFDAWQAMIGLRPLRLLHLSSYYPPLFYIIAAPLTMFSSHPDAYCIAEWPFLLATMWATWLLAREVIAPAAALAAGLIIPAFVTISWMCRQPMLDLPLTFFVVFTLWLLADAKPLPAKAHALGIAIALGMLTKWPYVFFVTLPCAVQVAGMLRDATLSRSAKWKTIGCLAGWPLLIAGPWYCVALPGILHKAGAQLDGEIAQREGDPSLLSLSSATLYARLWFREYARLPLAIVCAAGAASLLLRPASNARFGGRHARGWSVILQSLASGYVILTLIANKDPRYLMPLVPLTAVIGACSLNRLKASRYRPALACACIGIIAMTYWNLFILLPPNRGEMQVEPIAEWVVAHARKEQKTRLLVIPNDWKLNATELNYALYRRSAACSAKMAGEPLTQAGLARYDFLLINEPPEADTGTSPNVQSNTAFVRGLADWHVAAAFTRGDGKKISLYAPAM